MPTDRHDKPGWVYRHIPKPKSPHCANLQGHRVRALREALPFVKVGVVQSVRRDTLPYPNMEE